MPGGGLKVAPDGRQAVLELRQIAVIDQPKWPAYDASFTPAVMTLKVVWKATDDRILFEDREKHFRFDGFRAIAQAEAAVNVPPQLFLEVRSRFDIPGRLCRDRPGGEREIFR